MADKKLVRDMSIKAKCQFYCMCVKRITLCNCLCSSSHRFSASASGTSECKSVFLILKISQYGRSRRFSFFQVIHVRIDIRINISISIGPMITKFGKQVYLQDLIQMRLIKQVLVTGHYVKITWQNKTTIFPLSECLWLPDLAGS